MLGEHFDTTDILTGCWLKRMKGVVKILSMESRWNEKGVKELIYIGTLNSLLKRDEGRYNLSPWTG